MSLAERFEKLNKTDEHRKFERIENPRSNKRDLHAFLLLEELFPRPRDGVIISDAMHDLYYLDYTQEELETLSDEQIVELLRCGVIYSEEDESIFFFT